ncbi:exported hypothetical protein [uncultured delta proteobacterium]|uniref:Uncharacterized protein n=1 Tax=uncultured delta proteobacterium TaxID=34034 RepID=A0A212KEQ2_9DELT|nr:exported hypothetical protein [uncultured delta proteobacterium]
MAGSARGAGDAGTGAGAIAAGGSGAGSATGSAKDAGGGDCTGAAMAGGSGITGAGGSLAASSRARVRERSYAAASAASLPHMAAGSRLA